MNATVKKWIGKSPWLWPLVGAALLWLLIGVITGGLKVGVLVTNLTLMSYLTFLSLSQTVVMTGGDGAIDLSIQYTVALAAYLASLLMASVGLIPGLLITLGICACVGVVNGFVNLFIKVPPMITTLAVGYIVYSCVLLLAAKNQGTPHKQILWFAQKARIGAFSPIIVISVLAVVALYILMYHTSYGRHLHAIGQNRKAAKLAGIKIAPTIFGSFIISSVLAGICGIMLGGYFGGAFQDMGVSYMLTSISATVIGGTSAGGGKSSVIGSVCGAFMLTMLVSFLNVSRLPAATQELIQGALLVSILVVSVPKKQVNI
ncbi:ABC transporter permease [Oscillibacter sp.]|uniref:ABC transporter permease n=1 Tax=Oscillibacter sp. TaxID=1945593 RepID=UPI00261D154E|nr:ABC transporter permease [Oscillibacter sp.]MDD3347396.1 ABC transporter permease [Oscillibacter sp.]